MYGTISDSLLSGLIPTVGVLVATAAFSIVRKRRDSRQSLHQRVEFIERALFGTKDFFGKPAGDGLVQQVAEILHIVRKGEGPE